MSNPSTNVSEYDAIAEAVQPYIDGAKSGKGDDMKPDHRTIYRASATTELFH